MGRFPLKCFFYYNGDFKSSVLITAYGNNIQREDKLRYLKQDQQKLNADRGEQESLFIILNPN